MTPSANRFDLIHIRRKWASQSEGEITKVPDLVRYGHELMRRAGIQIFKRTQWDSALFESVADDRLLHITLVWKKAKWLNVLECGSH